MSVRLIQFLDQSGRRRVGRVEEAGASVRELSGCASTYELFLAASRQGRTPEQAAASAPVGASHDFAALLAQHRVLLPLDHPDPAHCLVSGTGLTHLGSAKARDSMHSKLAQKEEALSDSMKIFRWGLEGGKPPKDADAVQPEWFYKGDGACLVPTGAALERPSFAEDGGEEAEIAGLYLIGDKGEVIRAGFALGNEFSDHVMERRNYLYLAHSKLRPASIGPELHVGELPAAVEGRVRILRAGRELWSAPFLSGEEHMTYRIAGLEHHHFKYRQFRRPGDIHVHFFGACVLSCADGIRSEKGDTFEIAAPPFTQPLVNSLG